MALPRLRPGLLPGHRQRGPWASRQQLLPAGGHGAPHAGGCNPCGVKASTPAALARRLPRGNACKVRSTPEACDCHHQAWPEVHHHTPIRQRATAPHLWLRDCNVRSLTWSGAAQCTPLREVAFRETPHFPLLLNCMRVFARSMATKHLAVFCTGQLPSAFT